MRQQTMLMARPREREIAALFFTKSFAHNKFTPASTGLYQNAPNPLS